LAASKAVRSAARRSSSTGSRQQPIATEHGDGRESQQPTRPGLDSLIAEITLDCYDEDEALSALENAFDDEAPFPIPATVVGEDIEVLSIDTRNGRRELIATCQRARQHHQIALLDINIDANQPASRLLAAYRRWLGA
jgi:hypothetical protein